jgi:hypothetical protein
MQQLLPVRDYRYFPSNTTRGGKQLLSGVKLSTVVEYVVQVELYAEADGEPGHRVLFPQLTRTKAPKGKSRPAPHCCVHQLVDLNPTSPIPCITKSIHDQLGYLYHVFLLHINGRFVTLARVCCDYADDATFQQCPRISHLSSLTYDV